MSAAQDGVDGSVLLCFDLLAFMAALDIWDGDVLTLLEGLQAQRTRAVVIGLALRDGSEIAC
jgi:hypothetical protein